MAEDMKEVGTPEDISADEREGFEIMIDLFDDSSDTRELVAAMKDLDDDEQQKVADYVGYVKERCN